MNDELTKNARLPLKLFVQTEGVKKRLQELLGDRAGKFATALVAIQRGSQQLQKCTPESIMGAAISAAALNLEVDPNLGEAYLVPYGEQAQFQLGYKGIIQLAMRSGQYKRMGCVPVYEGELAGFNQLEGEVAYDPTKRTGDKLIGYAAKFTLLNGFEKAVFWTAEACLAHGKRFSKSFDRGPWKTSTDAMCLKTVVKDLLVHWGPKSVEMKNAVSLDTKVFKDMNPENALTEGEIDVTSETVPTGPEAVQDKPSGAPELSEAQKTLIGTCEGCSFEDFRTFASTLGYDLSSVGSYGEVPNAVCESVLADVKNLAKFIKAYRK